MQEKERESDHSQEKTGLWPLPYATATGWRSGWHGLIEVLGGSCDLNIAVAACNNRHNLTTSRGSEEVFFRLRCAVMIALAAVDESAIRREAGHRDQRSPLPCLSSIVNNQLVGTIECSGHPVQDHADALAVTKSQATEVQDRGILSSLSGNCRRIFQRPVIKR